jgi:DNA-binding LytR/AlgR family response regulator
MAECQDAFQALEAIEKYRPDLLFLDIQMPEVNGFELLAMLEQKPFIIFSTAYDQYALKAFEVNAIDYLLKPFDQERFDSALERVKKLMQMQQDESEKIRNLIRHIQSEKHYLKNILVKKAGKILILNVNEVQWIEAEGDYANLHTSKDTYLVLQSLKQLETRLEPDMFVRVHRSSIVNLEAIKEIAPWSKGKWKIILKDGNEIVISRSGAQRLKNFML